MSEPVHLVYYTDPLCSWSWVFEGTWRRLRWEFGPLLQYEYRMGGLYADVQAYHDPINDVGNPAHVAPQWLEISTRTGVPLNPALWESHPPSSSYPACIAFKAARSFGPEFADAYLRRLRELAMVEAADVSTPQVLLDAVDGANALLSESFRVEPARFAAVFSGDEARDAFREDLKDARYRQIGRFPTLILYRSPDRGLLLTGCRPYAALRVSLARVAPDLLPQRAVKDLGEYVRRWHRVTVQEIADAFSWEPAEARRRLEESGLASAVIDSL
jgi:predicted DsbA family dithiol-disulfide isomerase